MDLNYAVIGNPIEHSLSPQIHTAFAAARGESIHYEKILAPLDSFRDTVIAFQQQGGKGMNVTVPFKLQACELAHQLSDYAEKVGAVNTLVFHDDNSIYGDNTDGIGLLRDIKNRYHVSLQNQRILLLGAGGAARGALLALLSEAPAQVTLSNRTVSKAERLLKDLNLEDIISVCAFSDLLGQRFDCVINATSASLQEQYPKIPKEIIHPDAFYYDMVYATKPVVFLEWVKSMGARHCADGLGMLIEQAAESYYLWRGVRPDTQVVWDGFRNS